MGKNLIIVFMTVGLCGCEFVVGPRGRLACYPSSTFGSRYIEPNDLGRHSYVFSPFENNGIVYTCRGGHIDVSHLRIAADYTHCYYKKTSKALTKRDKTFTFRTPVEASHYIVTITYPPDWASEGDKEQVVHDVSLITGEYLGFVAMTWHEIITWFGYQSMGVIPEFPSAFSWEDIYSNLLGAHLAVRALDQNELSYNKAMTHLLDDELTMLGARPKQVAWEATDQMRERWFQSRGLILIKKANFDIGLDDGMVSPVRLAVVEGCDENEPVAYPVPSLEALSKYGFSIEVEIEPRVWQANRIYKIIEPQGRAVRIRPSRHFPAIMAYIENEAVEKYGYLED